MVSAPRPLDMATWVRREHFRFFRDYEKPWFDLCAEVDVSALHRWCRSQGGPSFFVASLWLSLKAANEVEELHYRIRGEQVVVHDVIHGGSTVLVPDGTFRFAYFDYDPDFDRFARQAHAELGRVREESGPLRAADDRDDLIHYSIIPWVAFTSFSHARRRAADHSVPRIVFGRHHEAGGARRMPVSVEVHHALVDGLHVARFFERFQHHLDACGPALVTVEETAEEPRKDR